MECHKGFDHCSIDCEMNVFDSNADSLFGILFVVTCIGMYGSVVQQKSQAKNASSVTNTKHQTQSPTNKHKAPKKSKKP